MAELPLLVTIAVALAYALAGGLVARRLGLPTIVGYLVAGVALGPFTPGYRGDVGAVRQLAEFGVILLMFGIGLEFSFRALWQVRNIAIPGALVQMVVMSALGWALAVAWGWSSEAGWLFGIALSVASTVVLLRGLMDNGWLDTLHGRVAVGWSIVEDLATVAILVLLPSLAGGGSAGWQPLAAAVVKAVAFLALMLLVGNRLVPALLGRIAHTRSRELFVLVALVAAAGTALASAAVFGVSVALGAFVAGVVVGESPFSHQVGADLLPFREAFAVLFFVSVGMLVNPAELAEHWGQVLAVTGLLVVGKAVIGALIAVVLPYPVRTALVVGAVRSQIGEFSFIIGQAGVALGVLDQAQYSLILAGAIVSITLNPLVCRLVNPAERFLKRRPRLWRVLNHEAADVPPPAGGLSGHVVIIGSGRVGRHIAEALGRLQIARLVVEVDPARLDRLRALGIPVLYGDAANSEILNHAALDRARALVITVPDDATAMTIVATSRAQAPNLRIIARASTWDGARRLALAGANDIVRPELEGGVEIVRRTLLDLDLPVRDVQRYTDLVRSEGLDDAERPTPERARVLDDLVQAARGLEIGWLTVSEDSAAAGRPLVESALRARTGVSVVAIGRGASIIASPGPDEQLAAGDRLAVIGSPDQVNAAEQMLRGNR